MTEPRDPTPTPAPAPTAAEEQQRELLRSVHALEVDPPAPGRDPDDGPPSGEGRAGDDGV